MNLRAARDPGAVLILGAGPTGLGAAYRLQEAGYSEWTLLEASQQPGGLATSFLDDKGFTWDIGGHVQFSHYPRYDRMIDEVVGEDRIWHERDAWVWVHDRFVRYPFQYNLDDLCAGDRARALSGLDAARARAAGAGASSRGRPDLQPKNFREWIDSSFGAGIAELFMVPYNCKVWGYPLETLGVSWVGQRVAVLDLERARGRRRQPDGDLDWGPNRRFFYPLRGGTGAIWHRLAERLGDGMVEFGATVVGVDLDHRSVSLGDGRSLSYDTLVSTLPLDRLCRICERLDPKIEQAAAALVHSSCHILGVGLRGMVPETLRQKTWIYCPGTESPYYRVTVLSNYSPNNAPEGCWSLMAEVCETAHRPIEAKTLGSRVVAALRRDQLVPVHADVLSLWHRREEHGYPTPTVGRDAVLAQVLPALEARHVYSRGRFGAWKYEVSNQDHSFMQGLELVERLLGLGEETTLPHPEIVNHSH